MTLTAGDRFLHRLALALGRTVAELRAGMSYNELRAWDEYYRLEPWGPARDNMHAGLVASTLVNINRRKGTRAATFQDFMLTAAAEQGRDNMRRFRETLRALARPRGE